MITKEQKAWAKKLEKLLATMPAGIELVVGHGSFSVLPAGWYMQNIWEPGADMMLSGGRLISEASEYIGTFNAQRIRPNSESI